MTFKTGHVKWCLSVIIWNIDLSTRFDEFVKQWKKTHATSFDKKLVSVFSRNINLNTQFNEFINNRSMTVF